MEYAGWELHAAASSIRPEPNDIYYSKRSDIFFNRIEICYTNRLLTRKPKSKFARFCVTKYLKLINPKLEKSLFGNLDQRNLLNSNEYPKKHISFTHFVKWQSIFGCFIVLPFLLAHKLRFFQVKKGCRYSDVYMESVNGEKAFLMSNGSSETELRMGFTVIPGFRVGKSVVQCQVYLC
uniref:GIL1/IRKI C-terminal domain-containing protein n=1 Tax=Solanum lycopersicum TaxID=4081 RepID=K4DCW9_SOLLC